MPKPLAKKFALKSRKFIDSESMMEAAEGVHNLTVHMYIVDGKWLVVDGQSENRLTIFV